MNDYAPQDVTTQILIQIREEMRAMRTSFDARFDVVEARLEGLHARMDSFDARMEAMEARMDSIEIRMNSLERRLEGLEKRMAVLENRMDAIEEGASALELTVADLRKAIEFLRTTVDYQAGQWEALEARIDAMGERSDTHHQELFRRFSLVEGDLKDFAKVVNDAVLHYADEMDKVRDRLSEAEDRMGISYSSE